MRISTGILLLFTGIIFAVGVGLLVEGSGAMGKPPFAAKPSATGGAINPEDSNPLGEYGPAPELTNTVWLNTDKPLRLQDLRGKVVLLDMFTFDCINCRHTVPTLRGWYQQYNSQGLVIIGNHFPEWSFEMDLHNLKTAIKDQQIPYPVAQDNDGTTWDAYQTRYWPTMYLIDKQGQIRYTHIGEGNYQQTEQAIKTLLAEH